MKLFAFCLLLLGPILSTATAQSTVFIVRHAEKVDASKDPDLSDAGRARSEALAKILRDAKIAAIYATEFKRTQQTAAPLAKTLGIPVTTIPANDGLAKKLLSVDGNALVVGHSNTIPDLVKALGISESITIADNDYDNLFVLVLGERPHLLHLRFP